MRDALGLEASLSSAAEEAACGLVIFDKGKPVARRGRKAMGPLQGGLPGYRKDRRLPGIMGPLLASRRARVLFGNYDFGTREDLMRMPEPIPATARRPATFCGPTPLGTAVPVCQVEMQHD